MSRMTSELEGAVLGVIRQEGPCTAYIIRKRFMDSPSPQWSGSAGAIYPLVKRLEEKRFLTSRTLTGTKRGGRLYSLTSTGRKILRAWIAPPLNPTVMGVPADPLRTRVGFLGALNPAERREFISEALAGTSAAIEASRAELRESRVKDDPWRVLVARGALSSLLARRAWLRDLSKSLCGRNNDTSRSTAKR